MPDDVTPNAKFVMASQFMVRPATLNYVFNTNYVVNKPQPLGSTPLWCKTAPDGSNNQVFYEAANANRPLYLPSFEIAKDNADRPLVTFQQLNKPSIDTTLTITLKPQPPSAAQVASASGATPSICPPAYYTNSGGTDSTTVQLAYSSGGTKHLAFDQVTSDPVTGMLVCVAKMTDYAIIGEVMGTLVNNSTDTSQRASLNVTRTINAIGVAAGSATGDGPAGTPTGPTSGPVKWGGPWRVLDHRNLRMGLLGDAAVARVAQPAAVAQPAVAALGITRLGFHPGVGDWIGKVGDIGTISQPPQTDMQPPAGTPLYMLLSNQPMTATLPGVWFLETLNGAIIQDVKGVTPTQAGYKACPVPGYDNPLFQDLNDPASFFYLPDSFKVVRSDTAPHLPLLTVTISGTTLQDAHATVFFTALPVVDSKKLENARNAVQAGETGHTITLQPMPTPKGISYGLYLPGTTPFVTRDVPVSLDDPLSDSPQLTLDDFQAAFASLTVQNSQYLQGKVSVPIGDTVVTLPLTIRADDFPGALFQQARTDDSSANRVTLVLTNAVESAIQVDALPVIATRAGAPVTCTVTCQPPLPAAIPAADDDHPTAGTLTVTVTPNSGTADASLDLAVDQSRCHVVPDAQALLGAVLNPNVPVKASRDVTVVVPAVLFDADSPDKKILIITMSFQNGNTIRFVRTPDSPPLVPSDKPGQVDLTVFDYVLRRAANASGINYKLAITYANGHTASDSNWRAAPNDNFVLDLP